MAGMHLSEIELLELGEKQLAGRELAGAEAHVETCAACRTALQELETGRDVLRASPLLELSPTTLAGALRSLPAQEREPRARRWLESPRRLALLALPVAAIAIVAVTVSLTVGGNGDDAGSRVAAGETMLEAAQAEAAAPADGQDPAAEEAGGGGGESSSPATEDASAKQPVLVVGPIEEVVKILEDAGFAVRVEDATVTVVGASPEEIARLLAERPEGAVKVVVVP